MGSIQQPIHRGRMRVRRVESGQEPREALEPQAELGTGRTEGFSWRAAFTEDNGSPLTKEVMSLIFIITLWAVSARHISSKHPNDNERKRLLWLRSLPGSARPGSWKQK